MTFDLYRFRFTFSALDPIFFPAGMPGNIVRGALGGILRRMACVPECPGHASRDVRECDVRMDCAYARIFEPASRGAGPSGLSDWPRPFVLRAAHLGRQTFAPGQSFWFDVNLFEMRLPVIVYFERAFRQLAAEGLGPDHGRAELISVDQPMGPMISIPLDRSPAETHHLRIIFRTPTELKTDDGIAGQPDFGVLLRRARDRVSTLRALYGTGPLEIDFQALGERASAVKMTGCQVRRLSTQRRSSRTGQSHGIGGFVGWAEYTGDLREFLPILQAAQWTGVGRHAVWGNGEVQLEAPFPL